MTDGDDLLRRSMAAAPEDWLDAVVTERVMDHAQRAGATRQVQPCPALQPERRAPSLAHAAAREALARVLSAGSDGDFERVARWR